MNEGDRLADRWLLAGRVSTRDGIERWRAVAVDTGEPVEILMYPAGGSPADFADLHGVLSRARDPALAHTLDIRSDNGRTWVVRVAAETATLDTLANPLDSATVAWIGATLVPAVLAAGRATRGALRATDVTLDPHGHPILAPPIEPLTRVALGSTRSVAPESFDGRKPDGAAGLYGLGVLLYTLATGREPATVGTRAHRPPPPPPSAVRHGIPEALDRAILRLLSSDPGQRVGALPMLQDLAGPPVDLRPKIRSHAPVEVRTAAPTRSAREDDDPGGLVLVPAAALAALDPAARSHAAGLANLPITVVDALVAAGLPLVLETRNGRTAARERAAELARTTGLPVAWGTPLGLPGWLWVVGGVLASGLPALAGFVFLALGLLPAAVVLWSIALVGIVAGVLASRRQDEVKVLYRAGIGSRIRAREARAEREAAGWLASAWDRLSQLRLELARTELPTAASADLRSALKDIEGRLDTLGQVARTADRTLRQVDLSALRTRLATLTARAGTDLDARVERDRLARTVADLDAVEARRATLPAEASRIGDLLGEIAAVVGQVAAEVTDEAALDRLHRATRRARDEISDPAAATAAATAAEPGRDDSPERRALAAARARATERG